MKHKFKNSLHNFSNFNKFNSIAARFILKQTRLKFVNLISLISICAHFLTYPCTFSFRVPFSCHLLLVFDIYYVHCIFPLLTLQFLYIFCFMFSRWLATFQVANPSHRHLWPPSVHCLHVGKKV